MAAANPQSGYYILADGTTAALKYAVINASASGNNTLVAGVTGKKIRVISLFYMSAGTVNVTFQSGAGGTALTGAIAHTAQTGVVLNENFTGWFQTLAGALLNVNLSAAISIAGSLSYIEI